MGPLLEAVRTHDRQKANEWSRSVHWATVEQLMSATSSAGPSSQNALFGNNSGSSSASNAGGIGAGAGSSDNARGEQSLWTCSHCTYLNLEELNTCEMCSLPR